MSRLFRWCGPIAVVAAIVVLVGGTPGDAGGGPLEPVYPTAPISMEALVRSDRATLESLYHMASPGSIPSGYLPGRAIPSPGTSKTVRKSHRIGVLWKGKDFPDDHTMLNVLAGGVRAVRTDVYMGDSWFDGRPSIILDYANSTRIFRDVRDEMREIAPGLYLGMTYIRKCPEPKLALFYTVQVQPVCSSCSAVSGQ